MKKKFTLIELLIVIAVIGVLVTLLLPSLTKARIKAQMAVCKSNLAQIYRINMVYAVSNNQFFVYRKAAADGGYGTPYAYAYIESDGKIRTNDQELLREMKILQLVCPLTENYRIPPKNKKPVRFENTYLSYSVFFGWNAENSNYFPNRINTKLTRIGEPFQFKGEEVITYASDILHYLGPTKNTFRVTHDADIYQPIPLETVKQDTNYVKKDGSVSTINKVTWNDVRMQQLPHDRASSGGQYLLVPKD